ncbi:MAG: PASTA domain-containing protein [Micromonosporaceae bacterium]
MPGFTRGIDFLGPLAFIGLSQVRESAVFSGIPLVQRLRERTCGVWVVNIETGEVWRLPTKTMEPERVGDKRAPSEEKPEVVAGGGQAYLVDRENRKLTALDARPDKRRDVSTPAPVDVAVVDGSGAAWGLARSTGELYLVADGRLVRKEKVATRGEAAQLTLAGGRPVVYRPAHGKAATYNRDGVIRRYNLPPVSRPVLVPTSPVKPSVLVAVVAGTADVYALNLGTGQWHDTQLAGREGSTFGHPAVLGNLMYVPDLTKRHVVLLELKTLRQRDPVDVPGGKDPFEVFVRDNRVWVNDPYAPTMLVFDRDGRHTEVDRSGRAVDEAHRDPAAPDPPNADAPARPDSPGKPPVDAPSPDGAPKPDAPKVTVPDVVGMDKGTACRLVERARLNCRHVSRPDDAADTGEVLEADPDAGAKVGVGAVVTIVSAGPAMVPNVVNMTVEDACATLQKARFTCAKDAQGVANTPAEVNKVYGQQPAQGTAMTTGSPVTVTYPVPGWIKVPELRGGDPNTACQTLQSYGLACSANPHEVTWQPNVVHAQNVPAGTAVQAGSAIEYVYQDNGPVVLDRWKLKSQETRFMAPRGQAPPPNHEWAEQTEMGGVYGDPNEVSGLVWVYRFRCDKDCGDPNRDLAFLFQRNTDPRSQQWRYQGPAFACFAPNSAPQGTQPLEAMHSESREAWAFAVRGTGEWNWHRDPAHGAYQQKFTVCNIWFGVPGFRPNG